MGCLSLVLYGDQDGFGPSCGSSVLFGAAGGVSTGAGVGGRSEAELCASSADAASAAVAGEVPLRAGELALAAFFDGADVLLGGASGMRVVFAGAGLASATITGLSVGLALATGASSAVGARLVLFAGGGESLVVCSSNRAPPITVAVMIPMTIPK
jgi:hypothetical protein